MAATAEKSRVYLVDVPGEAEKLIWQMQAQALAPLVAAGKLGCVLFQFPHWFTTPGVLTSATFRSFVARRRRVSTAIRHQMPRIRSSTSPSSGSASTPVNMS